MKLILSFFFILTIGYCYASPYPVIDSIRVEKNSDGADYYIHQTVLEIGSAGDVIVPSGWYMGLAHKHREFNGEITVHYTGMVFATPVRVVGNKTASEVAMQSYQSQQRNTLIHHAGSNDFQECVAYIGGDDDYIATWDTSIRPGGCLNIPPAEDWCKLTTPEIILDHGAMTLQNAEGDSVSSTIAVECTTPTSVTFNLITNDKYVYLDEGKTEIMVDDKPLNTKIDLALGNSQLSIKDKLTGVTSEGYHTGSSVLVMMPY